MDLDCRKEGRGHSWGQFRGAAGPPLKNLFSRRRHSTGAGSHCQMSTSLAPTLGAPPAYRFQFCSLSSELLITFTRCSLHSGTRLEVGLPNPFGSGFRLAIAFPSLSTLVTRPCFSI